jgi:hypothetical protein
MQVEFAFLAGTLSEVGRLWEKGCFSTHFIHERIDFFILVNG